MNKRNHTMREFDPEDRYDDDDYADYELMDYEEETDPDAFIEEDEDEDERLDDDDESDMDADDSGDPRVGTAPFTGTTETRSASGMKIEHQELNQGTPQDLNNARVQIEKPEVSKKRFAQLANVAMHGTKEEKSAAYEEACLYLKGYIRKSIQKKYQTYANNDPSFYEDLMQNAYLYVIENLAKYDPEKGAPSTFFSFYIKSALSSQTNVMKHAISPADASVRNRMLKIKKKYEEMGRTPTISDYAAETSYTMSKIRSILPYLSPNNQTYLDDEDPNFGEHLAGDSDANSTFETPEKATIRKILGENIVKRMRELATPFDLQIWMMNKLEKVPIPQIAEKIYGTTAADDKVRRIIEKMQSLFYYDSEIRRYSAGYYKDGGNSFQIGLIPEFSIRQNIELLENMDIV